MERIPEPQLMLDFEQCKQYDNYTDTYQNVREYVELYTEYINVTSGTIVDLGSGTCSFVIGLCEKFPDLKFVCYELSDSMLTIATEKIKQKSLQDRITLIKSDILTVNGKYDVVLANRVLHHIDDTVSFWETINRLSDKLLVVDINRPKQDVIDFVSTVDINPVYRLDLVNSMKAAYSKEEVLEQIKDYPFNVYVDNHKKLIVYHNK
jgi:ubiquinone/menaquinone biosynthesis C-methylase UbiE